jgi:hypothetical protein
VLAAVHTLTGTMQRNVLRYRRALPNGGWRLLQGPADIFVVCSSFTQPRESHFSCVTAFHFYIRCPARDWYYPQHSMGPQRDRRSWHLLHHPRRYCSNRRTRGRIDHSRMNLPLQCRGWLFRNTNLLLTRLSLSIHS